LARAGEEKGARKWTRLGKALKFLKNLPHRPLF